MSDYFNVYCRGYVAVPIIEACRKRGLFEALDAREFRTRARLIKELKASAGYFTTALQSLESLGWIESNDADAWRLTPVAAADSFDLDLSALYAVEAQKLVGHASHARQFAGRMDKLLARNERETELMQGAVILPLVAAFREPGAAPADPDALFKTGFDRVDPRLARVIERLFLGRQWLAADKSSLTATGRRLLQTDSFAMAMAYRPMLAVMEDLLFGKTARASGKSRKQEIRVDGKFRVIAENLRHQNCLEDLQRAVIDILDRQPAERRPQSIINVGCAGGVLLKEIHRSIQDRRPLSLFAIDDNPHALQEAERTLQGLAHRQHQVGADRPEALAQALRQDGWNPEQPALHIRAFADHRISVERRHPADAALAVLAADQPACYLDRQGRLLDPLTVLSRRQRQLQAVADNIDDGRCLVLETHALPARLVRRQPEDSEDFYFDTLNHMSGHYLIGAEAFIILAAGAGLFNDGPVKRYPAASAPCRISLHNFSRRDYIVRHARKEDLPRLYELEELCWQHTRTPKQRIRTRLQRYPQGQFVLEKAGRVVGVIYSQRIEGVEALEHCNAANVHELHRDSGPVIQLLAVNVDPAVQDVGYGDQLLEFMLQRSALVTGVERVAAVTLCKKYETAGAQSFEDYIRWQGNLQDPVLAFHQAHGASIVKALADYRPQDKANRGYGVLVAYDIHHRVPQRPQTPAPDKVAAAAGPRDIERSVRDRVLQLLGGNSDAFDPQRPLMEMGLDSADLLQLQQQIEEEFGRKLHSGFFFEYSSAAKVVARLAALTGGVDANAATQTAPAAGVAERRPDSAMAAQTTEPAGTIAPADIAVIGMACRLPGGIETPGQLWEMLAAGGNAIGPYPRARGEWYEGADRPGIDLGGFIEHADAFDAAFFRVSPAEAQVTDPQQRILLELAWACLEDAAILPESLKGSSTGVFIGASNCDYGRLIQAARLETQAHHATGSSLAVLANRISYFFDFCGPSLLIDTACSASLVALHTAVQSLRTGECSAALVGGVNLICHPDLSVAYHKAGMLAPDGQCKVFDAAANGYVRSEGAVVILLKPLRDAVAASDRIHAVIKGSAINHGGLAGGLTVPNPQKQSELLMAAWRNAGVSARDFGYLEAHGTGTSLGDPIEIQGIQMAFGSATDAAPCAIGSIKSNLGHLESAAGITGLLKVILSMQHRHIPASINFGRLNPKISLDGTPLYIAGSHQQWDDDRQRLAGVSSFGSGGANAHVVIKEWIQQTGGVTPDEAGLFILSARNRERLAAYAGSVVSWIKLYSANASFADFIHTFQTGRTAMEERLAVQASGFAELQARLQSWLETGETGDTLWQENSRQAHEKLGSLLQGDSARQIAAAALAGRNLKQLALLWTAGFDIDFKSLYGSTARRISVPSYPFARQKYWIQSAAAQSPEHPLLGSQLSSAGGSTVFAKSWRSLPEDFIFTQDDFSCLSLGFILETFLAAGRKVFPMLEIVAVDHFEYHPFHFGHGGQISCETLCRQRGHTLFAELVQIEGGERILVAAAELKYSERNGNEFSRELSSGHTEWIASEEQAAAPYRLPVRTLASIFPALLDAVPSASVRIPRILFYGAGTPGPSLLVALNPGAVSILTSNRQPLLSIHR